MKTLSQLTLDAQLAPDIQKLISEKKTPDEISWIKCKKYVDDLIVEPFILVKEELHKNPLNVKRRQHGGFSIITFYRKIEGYDVLIEIVEDNQFIRKARYTGFNEKTNTAYVRDVVKWKKEES